MNERIKGEGIPTQNWHTVAANQHEERVMAHEVRKRILRPATPEERERHGQIRAKVDEELPELKHWAHEAATRQVFAWLLSTWSVVGGLSGPFHK